jgi:hypothetical protein
MKYLTRYSLKNHLSTENVDATRSFLDESILRTGKDIHNHQSKNETKSVF